MTDESELPPILQSFDNNFRCNICKAFFEIPVSIRCGHCFCSGCIRSHLSYAQKHHFDVTCPECRQPAEHRDIRKVLSLCAQVEEYRRIRAFLVSNYSSIPPPKEEPVHRKQDQAGKIRVPPVLHKSSVTAVTLRGKLREWELATDGNKDELWRRYQALRNFILQENDAGTEQDLQQVIQKFKKLQKTKQSKSAKEYFSRKEDVSIEMKTHQDLIEEIQKRKRKF